MLGAELVQCTQNSISGFIGVLFLFYSVVNPFVGALVCKYNVLSVTSAKYRPSPVVGVHTWCHVCLACIALSSSECGSFITDVSVLRHKLWVWSKLSHTCY